MSPTGLHQNHSTNWSLLTARMVAERVASSTRVYFSALASASVWKSAPADSNITHLLKHYSTTQ